MSLRGPNDADTEDKRPVQDALDLLKSLKPQILGILNPDGVQQSQTPSQSTFQPLRIPLTTLDILKPEKNGGANVLWVGPDVSVLSGKKSAMIEDQYHSSEIEDLAKLVQVSDLIHQTFKRQGFIVDSRPLKLHCTLVNTAHRKVRGVPFGYQSILASQALRTLRVRDKGTALDRTLLTPKPSSSPFEPIPINLGTWSAREVQICIMGSHGPENELYGISILQAYQYFMRYPHDSRMKKFWVVILFSLDTVNVVFAIHSMYYYLIFRFGELEALQTLVWSVRPFGVAHVLVIWTVHGDLQLVNFEVTNSILYLKTSLVRAIMVALLVIVCVAFAAGVVELEKLQSLLIPPSFAWVILFPGCLVPLLIDMSIAAMMCFLLWSRPTSDIPSRMDAVILVIVRYVVSTGLLTSMTKLAYLLLFSARPDTLLFLGVEFSGTRLYVNSYLALLNARDYLRNSLEPNASLQTPSDMQLQFHHQSSRYSTLESMLMQPAFWKVFGGVVAVGLQVTGAHGQTWCGKHYMSTSPIVPPGGQFQMPPATGTPFLALRCAPAIRPYLPADADSPDGVFSTNAILIDTPVRFVQLPGSTPIQIQSAYPDLEVTVSINGKTIASGNVPLNATKHALPFSLKPLTPQNTPFNLSCSARLPSSPPQTFHASGALSFLPNPPSGIASVTKMDLRTGALLARPADGKGGDFSPVFPIGFYTQFDNYLAKNLSVLNELKAQGFTIVHPIPNFNDPVALNAVLDRMQEVGLYLMYDMRNTYMNTTSVTAQVNNIKSRPNLLLWYTADEPDGTSDPLDATANAYNLITSLDGGPSSAVTIGGAGYHPVSLVLNCENFDFTAYTSGSDIVMQDTYMIGNNVTFSSQCDNCVGEFEDISRRMDEFAERLFINGWDRTKAVWTVPQAFGLETYWKRLPTGKEFIVQSLLGVNHGGLGIVPWDDPTPADIKASASALALALPKMTPFIFNPEATIRRLVVNRVDIGLWTVGKDTLVVGTNMNYAEVSVGLSNLPNGLGMGVTITQVFNSDARTNTNNSGFTFEEVGSGAWVLSKR
ncbi:hypothetical protein ONZ45_g1216 [Pleurotus djamor]|nr:hypothetical protein ONZ45_g1216 [Pleurotus djamor]